ncbi:PK1R-like protein, partial [Mya arenaria]
MWPFAIKDQAMSGLKRVVRIIIVIWLLAVVSSIPLTLQFKVVYAVDHWNRTIPESAYCGIGENNHIERNFELSTFVIFVFPMTLITVMNSMIAIAIRKSDFIRNGSDASHRERLTGTDMRAHQQARVRQSVLKVLEAVVVACFVCWAPFHEQRLMTLYIPASKWTDSLLDLHKFIYYTSGVCYFVSCTINPILYSIMSLKFRQAFKQTVIKPNCCRQRLHSMKKEPIYLIDFHKRTVILKQVLHQWTRLPLEEIESIIPTIVLKQSVNKNMLLVGEEITSKKTLDVDWSELLRKKPYRMQKKTVNT